MRIIFAQQNSDMIQRIQSVFLFLAALAAALLFIFPYVEVGKDDYFVYEFTPQLIFALIIVCGTVIDIFFFGNRPLQMRIIRILLIFLIALIGYGIYQLIMVDFKNLHFESGTLLPAFIGYFLLRARQSIQKDENLVRDMDRLR